jgi:serine/threonine protein kinase
MGEKLGEGASGTIYRGTVAQNGTHTDVAIKMYKANMTSDGNPDDEMNATIAAGNHPGLLPVIGLVTQHPEGKKGLVMQLLNEQYKVLGLPPTFASCTRDVFTEGQRINTALARHIAATVAGVCAHLHAGGIIHGDLYAHNLLTDRHSHTIVSDFGAACHYNRTNKHMLLLEKIEVAAFGHLLEDLVSISEPDDILQHLANRCINTIVAKRPTFATIASQLANGA